MTRRLQVGVIGAGLIAQVMHLNYLRELSELYDVRALCDISEETAKRNADLFGIPNALTDWRELLDQPLDAVLILASGNHAEMAEEAARAGKHVLVEKPMCFSVTEGRSIRDAAAKAGVVVMVGYPKRYDPALARFQAEIADIEDPALLRVTTFESPYLPYVEHYGLKPNTPSPAQLLTPPGAGAKASIDLAIGEIEDVARKAYVDILLDTLVHEINTTRAVLGEPTMLDHVNLGPSSLTVLLTFGRVPVAIHWLDLPGISRYEMEFALYGADKRVTMSYPSPFLRGSPTLLEIEGGDVGTPRSWRVEETNSYANAFKLELKEFHQCIVDQREPPTDATDALHDIALCQSIVHSYRTGSAIADPSSIA